MARVEVCDACGREISGDMIPRRVLGRVLCPPCDRKRVQDINRRDRGLVMIFLAAAHTLFGIGLIAAGGIGIAAWWSGPAEETSLMGFLTALVLLPSGLLFAWVGWNLWKLEGRGRLIGIVLDAVLAVSSVYLLLDGDLLAFFGLIPLFGVIYLSRSATADRFW